MGAFFSGCTSSASAKQEILDYADSLARDGQLSYADAKTLVTQTQALATSHSQAVSQRGNSRAPSGVLSALEEIRLTQVATYKSLAEHTKCSEKAKSCFELAVSDPDFSHTKLKDGVEHDRELLNAAEDYVKDGRISYAEIKALIDIACDSKTPREAETATLKHIKKSMTMTQKAKDELERFIRNQSTLTGLSYYKQINGVKYDRSLLQLVEESSKAGPISLATAKEVLKAAQDGKGVTKIEKQSVVYSLNNFRFEDDARNFLVQELKLPKSRCEPKPAKRARKEVGSKYDSSLLSEAESAVADGPMSRAQALSLVATSQESGIGAMEKAALSHISQKMSCTASAKSVLKSAIEDASFQGYKTSRGITYDKALLDAASKMARDGKLNLSQTKQLITMSQDNKEIGDVQKSTLKHILDNSKMTDTARSELKFFTGITAAKSSAGPAKQVSYYKVIGTVRYDAPLLDLATAKSKAGPITVPSAKELLDQAKDSKRIGEVEKATLEHILKTKSFKFTSKAREFMTSELKANTSGAYYIRINGVKYDRQLLAMAEELAKKGTIGLREAQMLFNGSKDGPGITDCERLTLQRSLNMMSYTDEARKWLVAELAL